MRGIGPAIREAHEQYIASVNLDAGEESDEEPWRDSHISGLSTTIIYSGYRTNYLEDMTSEELGALS